MRKLRKSLLSPPVLGSLHLIDTARLRVLRVDPKCGYHRCIKLRSAVDSNCRREGRRSRADSHNTLFDPTTLSVSRHSEQSSLDSTTKCCASPVGCSLARFAHPPEENYLRSFHSAGNAADHTARRSAQGLQDHCRPLICRSCL